MGHEAGLVEADHVDTVYRDPVDFAFEFENERLVARLFADIFDCDVDRRENGKRSKR
jgi:hypothetical protein